MKLIKVALRCSFNVKNYGKATYVCYDDIKYALSTHIDEFGRRTYLSANVDGTRKID